MKNTLEDFALKATKWVGSISSLITHTIIFVLFLILIYLGYNAEKVMLILTTLVSLEAIYLSLFIQMTVNNHSKSIANIEEDIDEIQEDVEDIQEDIDDIQEDVEEIQEDVEDIQEDVEEIQEDIDEITPEEAEERAKKEDLENKKEQKKKEIVDKEF